LSPTPYSPERRFEIAEDLEERGEYAAALNEWRALASDHPEIGTYCRLGNLAGELKLLDEAEQAFRAAIQLDETYAPAYANLALILRDKHLLTEAEELLRKALLYDRNPETFTILGALLGDLGRDGEAIENLRTALALDSSYEEAYYNLGMIQKKDDPASAESHFLKALEYDPDYTSAHRELGWLLNGQNDDARAEYHLRRAIELDGNDAWARVYLGNLLWRRGDVSASETEFQTAIEISSDQGYPYWSLANLYENQEQWEKAEKLYERALEIDPTDEVAHMNFGRMLKATGDTERAIFHLKRALSLDPKYLKAQELLASFDV
jgi:protein O-GlcNAc transferase